MDAVIKLLGVFLLVGIPMYYLVLFVARFWWLLAAVALIWFVVRHCYPYLMVWLQTRAALRRIDERYQWGLEQMRRL